MGLRQGKALALPLDTLSLGRSQLVGHWDKAALFSLGVKPLVVSQSQLAAPPTCLPASLRCGAWA